MRNDTGAGSVLPRQRTTTRRTMIGQAGAAAGSALLGGGGNWRDTGAQEVHHPHPPGGEWLPGDAMRDLASWYPGERPLTATPVVGAPILAYPARYQPGEEELAEDEVRVITLGTGVPFPRRVQAASSLLMEFGNGARLIFDTGTGSAASLNELAVPVSGIDAFFFSHLHIDHQGDFGMYLRLGRMAAMDRPLSIYGPSGADADLGIAAFVSHTLAANRWEISSTTGRMPAEAELVSVHEFDFSAPREVYRHNGLVVTSFPVLHVAPGPVGYRVDYRGRSVVYSGDTSPCRCLIGMSQNVDLLVHEAIWFPPPPHAEDRAESADAFAASIGHTTPRGVATVFSRCRPRMGAIFHTVVSPATVQPILDQVAARYDGPVTLTQDLTVFNITREAVVVRTAASAPLTLPDGGPTSPGFGIATPRPAETALESGLSNDIGMPSQERDRERTRVRNRSGHRRRRDH